MKLLYNWCNITRKGWYKVDQSINFSQNNLIFYRFHYWGGDSFATFQPRNDSIVAERKGGYRRLRIHKWRQMRSWQASGIIPRRNKSADRGYRRMHIPVWKEGNIYIAYRDHRTIGTRRGNIWNNFLWWTIRRMDPLFLMRYPEIDRVERITP